MKNVIFKVNTRFLPEEMNNWEWKLISKPPWDSFPEVPCVFVITKVEKGTTVPLQVSYSGNLKEFMDNPKNIENISGRIDKTSEIHYVEEQNESKRRQMRDRLKEFLGLHMAW